MSVSEKVAYLRGLMEGLDIDEDKKEGKLFAAIIDALDEIASDLSDIDEDLEDLTDYVEELDEDLGDVEEYLFGEDDECDCEDDDCDCCDCCDDGFFEIECPECGEIICIDEDFEGDVIECPACNKQFKIEDEDAE